MSNAPSVNRLHRTARRSKPSVDSETRTGPSAAARLTRDTSLELRYTVNAPSIPSNASSADTADSNRRTSSPDNITTNSVAIARNETSVTGVSLPESPLPESPARRCSTEAERSGS